MTKNDLLAVLAARDDTINALTADNAILKARVAQAEDWYRSMKERGLRTPDTPPTSFVTDSKVYPLVDKLGRRYRQNGNVRSYAPSH